MSLTGRDVPSPSLSVPISISVSLCVSLLTGGQDDAHDSIDGFSFSKDVIGTTSFLLTPTFVYLLIYHLDYEYMLRSTPGTSDIFSFD
jgi:hypothetical protein